MAQSPDASAAEASRRRKATLIAILVVVVLAVLYFVFTSDPLGLLPKAAPTSTLAPATITLPPAPTILLVTPTFPHVWVDEIVRSPGSTRTDERLQVFFTDPINVNDPAHLEGSIPARLIEYIQKAQRSIHIAAFEFNLTPVAEALIEAHQRGVEVLWLTDDEHGLGADGEKDRGQFAMLQQAGIEIRTDGRAALMHNKFWIFDQQIVWTGSTNITVNDTFRNNNNVLVLELPAAAAIYEREFQELWAGQSGPTSPSTVDDQFANVDGTPLQILFSSEDHVLDRLIPLIESAQSSIRFMAFSFTHAELKAAMLSRFAAGVDVSGIFETRGSETEFSALPAMFCAGVPVRQDGNPGTFHHKVIVIDERIVVTGSLNFSRNADESNDENVIVINSRKVARLYLDEFARRWAEARTPQAAKFSCP